MNADLLKKVSDLPWQIQVVLASGYCAYLIAYRGLRHSHKPADTVFSTLAFGLVAWAFLLLTEPLVTAAQIGLTLAGSLATGMCWRKLVRSPLHRLLRDLGYSWSDDTRSAWEKMLQEHFTPTQLTVELKDGRYLYCTDTSRVGKLPFGPYVLGAEGDLIMYVDMSERPGSAPESHEPFGDAEWGNLLTYIPKDEVRKISIRNLPVPNRPSAAAAE